MEKLSRIRMRLDAIIVGAGKGRRINNRVSKPLIKLNNRPILVHTLKKIESVSLVNNIILVVRKQDILFVKGLIRKFSFKKINAIVCGGRERFDSVRAGLARISRDCDVVLIHDAVRPFIDKRDTIKCIKTANRFGAAILGVPVKQTIKSIRDGIIVEKTLNRRKLWEIQTPQVFKKDIILRAYGKYCNKIVTDDSMLVERLGINVRVVRGSYNNIKITTPEDLIIAKAILKNV